MASVASAFEWFADWAEGVSPLYERLAYASADDEALLDIASEATGGQPPPNLLLGAVHALLLEDADHPLAEFYSTCREDPTRPENEDPFPLFREFCLAHEATIRDIVATRRVQTNEVGRSAVLFPAFKHVADASGEDSFATVEIGASAGLNLYWDQFRYEYEGCGTYGDPDSPVCIDSEVRGNSDPPLWEKPPEINHRVGIELNPLDVTDPADARWLRALVIPDQQARFGRLDSAIEMAKDDPPRLVEGNALAVLPEALRQSPPELDVCVYSTLVMYQLEESDIAALEEILAEQSQDRQIHWLSNDPITEETPPTYRYASFEDGMESRQLATFKAHGEWIRWTA